MHDARDVTERVDEAVAARGLEADDDVVAGEHALGGPYEHAALRQVEGEIADQAEVALAHDLAIDSDETAEGSARRAHRDRTVNAGAPIGPIFSAITD